MHIPKPTLRRLIRTVQLLSSLSENTVTSLRIQQLTGWTNATVRKDLSYVLGGTQNLPSTLPVSERCAQKHDEHSMQPAKTQTRGSSNGYNRTQLLRVIEHALNLPTQENIQKCCVVGLTSLAQALIKSGALSEPPFVCAAGFDASVNRTETLKAPFPLYPMARLESVVLAEHIRYAVLTAEKNDAKEAAKRLFSCGIKGIVNYSPAILTENSTTHIENLFLQNSLYDLFCKDAYQEVL